VFEVLVRVKEASMAVDLVLPKSVKRVTFVQSTESSQTGASSYEAFSQSSKKAKKQTAGPKMIGKWTIRSAKALSKFSSVYLARHERSNAKKRDGWIRDFGYNMMKANRTAAKALRLPVFKF
jgi:hypothetical protein